MTGTPRTIRSSRCDGVLPSGLLTKPVHPLAASLFLFSALYSCFLPFLSDQAFLSLPPDLFSSSEARETAKSTTARTIERALEEEREANEGDGTDDENEGEEEEEVEVQSDDSDPLRWLERGL